MPNTHTKAPMQKQQNKQEYKNEPNGRSHCPRGELLLLYTSPTAAACASRGGLETASTFRKLPHLLCGLKCRRHTLGFHLSAAHPSTRSPHGSQPSRPQASGAASGLRRGRASQAPSHARATYEPHEYIVTTSEFFCPMISMHSGSESTRVSTCTRIRMLCTRIRMLCTCHARAMLHYTVADRHVRVRACA